jgi:hypothetical protein
MLAYNEWGSHATVGIKSEYLEQKLKLQVNQDKSKIMCILSQKRFKFLGVAMGKMGWVLYSCLPEILTQRLISI